MSQPNKTCTALLVMALMLSAAAVDSVAIPCLSGFVRDTNGVPVVGADLDFVDPETGVKLVTPGDNTDASGFYNVCVLPGVYHVSYAPPPGTRLMGKMFPNMDLTENIGKELDVVLEFGTVVSGKVSDAVGTPIGDVDVDIDRISGGRVFTPDDDSDPATGIYRVVVPDDLYRFRFEPVPGSRWRGAEIDSVTVLGDAVLDVTLEQGMILDGRVSDIGGSPLPDVDVDLRDHLTGAKIFIANNSTDDSGDYAVAVPTGTFELRFSPQRGSRFVAEKVDSFVIAGDRRWDQILRTGVILSFVVQDTSGNPVKGVDIDVKLTSTGEKIFTPNDNTDAAGLTDFAVAPETYTLRFDPPLGTTLDRLELVGVPVLADTTITVQLKEVKRVTATGRVVDDTGTGLAGVRFEAHRRPGGAEVFIPVDVTDTMGFFNLSIPIGTYDVFVVPVKGTRTTGRKLQNVTVSNDSTWGEIILDSGWFVGVTVVTDAGKAVKGVDFDFLDAQTGEEVFTPYDNTDAAGAATVTVASGVYDIVITPPAGSGLDGITVNNFAVNADTSATFTLASASTSAPQPFALFQNYPNPFNGETTIEFELGESADVEIAIYNVAGQRVKVLESGQRNADVYAISWDGTNASGQMVASGVYYFQLRTPIGKQTRKMVLLR